VTERNARARKKAPPNPLPDHERSRPHHIHPFRRGIGERVKNGDNGEGRGERGAQATTKEEKGTHLNSEQLSWQFKERNTLQRALDLQIADVLFGIGACGTTMPPSPH